jgi:hypothetical protein
MVKITMEGKEINEKNQSAYYGWYTIHIQVKC